MIANAPFREPIQDVKNGSMAPSWIQWLTKVGLYSGSASDSGTTAQRPTTNLWIGRQYFDTTLGLPVFVKTLAPVWVTAAGAVV